MANFNFTAEAAENFEQKCLCVLVLDTSGSMNEIIDNTGTVDTGRVEVIDGKQYKIVEGGISRLDTLNDGLRDFYEEINNDDTSSQRLEIAIITFNDVVTTIQEPSLITNCVFPTLQASGETAMVDAVNEAINLVAARKQWYKDTNQSYYRPWIILMTDGEPNKDQDIASLASQIKSDCEAKKYMFLPIGVDNANMEVLTKIQGTIPAMKLKGTKFSSFFKWLSASMSTVTTSEKGQAADISVGAGDWMEKFVID